ncbi:MAG: M28 family peptidase [Bacteroidota bacterium]|nr:M28 family peptidase [Bacteroidota bacterium]
MKKLMFILLLFPVFLFSQDIKYAHNVIDSLSSPALNGRGYTYNGDKLASKFIANELKSFKIPPFEISYYQEFIINTNVFPNQMFVTINKKKLKAGVDYIIDSRSNSINGTFKIVVLDEKIISNELKFNRFKSKKYSNVFILVDTTGLNDKSFSKEYRKIVNENSLKARGIICFSPKLTYVPARKQKKFVRIIVEKLALPKKIKKITLKIDAKFLFRHKTRNVAGFIKGEIDSFIVLTAHFDHLGNMGKDVFFPGAHDNASGCAMVLNLAKDFSQMDSLKYGIAFIFFSGEELGLLGSKYYVDHPLFPLEKIKFLLNLDMMGSGDEGVQIVNSSIFINEYNLMLDLNKKYNLLTNVKKRGTAANSDHYFFYANGVPSYFIYSLGKYKQYHNIYDTRENIPLSGYNQMFKLFKLFILNL